MEQELILVNPSEEYLKELLDYRNEFLANGNSMDGCGPLRKFTDMKEYLNETNKYLILIPLLFQKEWLLLHNFYV